jgi:hypothetical protein
MWISKKLNKSLGIVEANVNQIQSDEKMFIRRKKGESPFDRMTALTVKHDIGNNIIWLYALRKSLKSY